MRVVRTRSDGQSQSQVRHSNKGEERWRVRARKRRHTLARQNSTEGMSPAALAAIEEECAALAEEDAAARHRRRQKRRMQAKGKFKKAARKAALLRVFAVTAAIFLNGAVKIAPGKIGPTDVEKHQLCVRRLP